MKSFNTRSLLSLGTFLFFILLIVSGIALHCPDYEHPTFALVYFKASHTIFGFGFLFFSIGHIWKNWKVMKSYITGKTGKVISKEMLIGLLIAMAILLITWVKAVNMANEHGISF